MRDSRGDVMLSEYTVGERIEQAHCERECDHVILSEAKDQRAADRNLSS